VWKLIKTRYLDTTSGKNESLTMKVSSHFFVPAFLLSCRSFSVEAWPESLLARGITQEVVAEAVWANGGVKFNEVEYKTRSDSFVVDTHRLDVSELYTQLLDAATTSPDSSEHSRHLASPIKHMHARDLEGTPTKQMVYINFNNLEGGVYAVKFDDQTGASSFSCFPAHFYTEEQQRMILKLVQADYEGFDIAFTIAVPEDGATCATLNLNSNVVAPADCTEPGPLSPTFNPSDGSLVAFSFGKAQGVDFRNLVHDDAAIMDMNIWKFVADVDPTGAALQAFTLLSLDNGLEALLEETMIEFSAYIIAHELLGKHQLN
jgi:hypothetical protein